MDKPPKKIVEQEELKRIVEELKSEKKKIVFTNGCFDILHLGHIRFLKQAKALGDILIVGVNSDRSVKKLKGPGRPIFSQAERTEILATLVPVDYITIFFEETPLQIIEKILPDVLVKGGDWGVDEIVGKETVEKNGGEVVSLPLLEGQSTSRIIQRIKNL